MSKFNVTLVFEDGRSESILADENDTIYMACLRNKIRILTDCLEGACATCKGHCVEGEYDMDDVSDEALSAEEAAQREVLEETGLHFQLTTLLMAESAGKTLSSGV